MLETRPEISDDDVKDAPVAEKALQEPLASLGIELGRISAEIQSINSGFQAQVVQALTDAHASMEREFEARTEARVAEVRREMAANFEKLKMEVGRVEASLKEVSGEIATLLDDPNAELSVIMRKKAEESVLRAYFDGLRFVLLDRDKR